MRKYSVIMIALIMAIVAGATSCKKKTPTIVITEDSKKIVETPIVHDMLRVKTAVQTIVYGLHPSNGYENALINRLENRVTSFNDSTTKAVIVFNAFVPSLTEEDYVNIYRCFANGGNLVICTPTRHNFTDVFREGFLAAAYKEEVLKYNTTGMDFESWKEYKGDRFIIDEIGKGSSDNNVFAICFGFHNGHKYRFGSIKNDELTAITAFNFGNMADGVVQWINNTQEDEKINFKSYASRDNELSDLTEAEVMTEEYGVRIDGNDGWYWNYGNVVQNTLTVYAAYSNKDNRDWYQVDQNITFRNGSVKPAPDINDSKCFWSYSNYLYIRTQGAFSTTTYMDIPQGDVVIYDSHPQAANSSMSSSSSTTEGTTNSVSLGGSVGFMKGAAGGTFSGNFSGSVSHSESFSSTTGTSCTINDLSITKNTFTEDGYKKVKWDYLFREPYCYSTTSKGSGDDTNYCNWWAPRLAISDCSQQNSLLYYVDNPSGVATVKCHNWWNYYFSWFYDGGDWTFNNKHNEADVTTTFVLPCTVRYYEEWGVSCIQYGDIQGNPYMISLFEERITNDIIGGSDNRINDVGGVNEFDNSCANDLLNSFMNDFNMFATSYAAQGFTGTYVFQLQAKETGRIITKEYTITR